MNFEAREDIEAPITHVFELLTDFKGFERSAMRRGAEVSRRDSLPRPGVGMAWDVGFEMRGKRRDLQVELTQFETPTAMEFSGRSPGLQGVMVLDLLALSPNRTRLGVSIEMQAKSLAARLFLQSLKLARGNLTKRFQVRVASFAKETEEGFSRRA